MIRKQQDKEVAKNLGHRTMETTKKNKRTDYLVQWKGNGGNDTTYERHVDLWQFEDKVNEYFYSLPTWKLDSSGGKGLSTP